jgi:hypothetical protein
MTRARGTTRSKKDVALAMVIAATLCGCDLGSAATPTFEGDDVTETPDATLDGGQDGDGTVTYAVCPPGMDASFGSIFGEMLSTDQSCGTGHQLNCHSTSGASGPGTGNGLDFSEGGAYAYKELINVPSVNLAGQGHPIRVVPGDASASFLYIKLTLKTRDHTYGAGMPVDTPGSVCPAALEAVKTWIEEGAPQN